MAWALGALAEAVLLRPRAMLGGAAAVLVVCAALAVGAPERLGLAGPEAPGSDSERASSELEAALGRDPVPAMLLVTRGRDPVESGVYAVALDAISSQAKAEPEVAAVRRGPVSRDERTTVLEVYFRNGDPSVQQQAAGRIEAALDPGPLSVLVTGEAKALPEVREDLGEELPGLELLALPLTVVVLVLAAGLRLAAAPLLSVALSILGSLAVLRLAGGPLDLSVEAMAPAGVCGLVLGIEFPLLLMHRYGDEVRRVRLSDEALDRTVTDAGREVVWAALAGALVALTLVVVPVPQARSAAAGGALACLLAAAATLVVTPALLALAPPGGVEEPQAWRRASSLLAPRSSGPWFVSVGVALVALAGLLVVARPGLGSETLALGLASLPADSEARRAEARLGEGPSSTATRPAPVSIPAAELRALRGELRRQPRVAAVGAPQRASEELGLLPVGLDDRPGSLPAREAVTGVREAGQPLGGVVVGPDAAALDADDALYDRVPLAAGIAALAVAALLFTLLRRTLLSAALGISVLLPAAAAAGALAFVFEDGLLTGPLDYVPQGAPHLDAVIAVLAGVAAVSAARSALFALTLNQERGELVGSVRVTLQASGSATLIGAAAALVLIGSDLVAAKELGLGVAAGLLLDLVGLRVLLVPAVARLVGGTRA
jgi:RND superfamily putative drug exporter